MFNSSDLKGSPLAVPKPLPPPEILLLTDLPVDVLKRCFWYLSVQDLVSCGSTCKLLHEIGNADDVWMEKCDQHGVSPACCALLQLTNLRPAFNSGLIRSLIKVSITSTLGRICLLLVFPGVVVMSQGKSQSPLIQASFHLTPTVHSRDCLCSTGLGIITSLTGSHNH